MAITYDQARADHEYLWEIYGPAKDMTGAYVDQDDLAKLLKSPTKKTATTCYVNQITYWFFTGPSDDFGNIGNTWKADPTVREIAERHGVGFDVEWTGEAAEWEDL